MGGQSVGRWWWYIEADLPTALGGGGRVLVISLKEQMTNQKEDECAKQKTLRNKKTQTVAYEQ
jgi:hypothetical protein